MAKDIFFSYGHDGMKFISSMHLFKHVGGEGSLFFEVLERFEV